MCRCGDAWPIAAYARAFIRDRSGYAGDYTNVGYETTADGGGNQGMPFNGNVIVGAYGIIIPSR